MFALCVVLCALKLRKVESPPSVPASVLETHAQLEELLRILGNNTEKKRLLPGI